MKNNSYILIGVLATSLSMGACNDLILDLTPQSVLTEADFYKTAQDLEGAVIGVYSSYQSRKPRDWAILEMPTDNIHRTGYFNIGGLDELNNLAFSSENPLFASFWQNTYNGIFRANAVLANLENPTDYADAQKDQLEGEAKFMRALFYFRFGPDVWWGTSSDHYDIHRRSQDHAQIFGRRDLQSGDQ